MARPATPQSWGFPPNCSGQPELGDNADVKRWWLAMVWCLSLALPLQGLAAVAPQLTMGSMHQMPGGQMPGDLPEDASPPCHAAAKAQAAPMQSIDADFADTATSGHAGCAQCAVCHASSAPAPQMLGLAGPGTHGDAPPAWQPPFLSSIDPDGFDRPPRTLLV